MKPALPLTALILLSACAAPGEFPSLNPRPIEAQAAGLLSEPAPKAALLGPSDPALVARIEAAQRAAIDSDAAFLPALERARLLVGAAGAAESESWIAAQMAISVAESHRAPVQTALRDLDAALSALRLVAPTEDIARVEHAIRETEALDARQSAQVQALVAALSR